MSSYKIERFIISAGDNFFSIKGLQNKNHVLSFFIFNKLEIKCNYFITTPNFEAKCGDYIYKYNNVCSKVIFILEDTKFLNNIVNNKHVIQNSFGEHLNIDTLDLDLDLIKFASNNWTKIEEKIKEYVTSNKVSRLVYNFSRTNRSKKQHKPKIKITRASLLNLD